MSAICIVDLKNHGLDFNQLNQLAKEIIQYTLNNNLAASFNDDYDEELIKEIGTSNFFLMSDSFLYRHADFLDTTSLFLDGNIDKFRKEFFERFSFFTEIIKILFKFKILAIDIYLDITNCSSIEDFVAIETNQDDFLKDLFDSVIKYANEYAYGFPTVKLEVTQ